MKDIIINAKFLTQEMTGVQRYASAVSVELKRMGLKLRFLSPPNIIHSDLARELDADIIGRSTGSFWEQADLPYHLNKIGRPYLLNLANMAPVSYANQGVVLHDLAFLRHPEWFSNVFAMWYGLAIPLIVKRSAHLFTISEFSKNEILDIFSAAGPKLVNAGNGLPSLPAVETSAMADIKGPYILTYGGNNKRKNVDVVLDAMEKMDGPSPDLVVLGRRSAHFSGKKSRERDSSGVTFLSEISDAELSALYQGAEALVYASLYEGFGLPPLEALSFGCPSVLSDIPAHREIYEGAALFADPNSPESFAREIGMILGSEDLRRDLTEKGKKLIEKHTFKKVAERIAGTIKAD